MLTNLNEQQKKAVLKTEGPLLVIAGAGSGKTKVLTTRIAHIIEENLAKPREILAITFTNKAAKEMKTRVIKLLGDKSSSIQISTFHSFGLLIIKENFRLLNYNSNFTILDSQDSLTIIKKIMGELNYDVKVYNPKMIKNKISSCKNELVTPLEYSNFASTEPEKIVQKVYEKYEEKLKMSNSLDFDDLLMKPIVLFNKHKEVLEEYQNRYKYILIDEYQDTNEAQYTLTKMLAKQHRNLCVVGDESQSIYSFRGSNYRNILNFEKDYPDAEVILLEKNYRSTKTILDAANDIIKNNTQRKEKNLWTDNEEGFKIILNKLYSEKDEARYVISEIKQLIESGVPREEIAVLYRTNAQSRNFEEAILKENIPYKVVGSFYFYQRKEIKDLISYLKFIHNDRDDISFLRIINTPKRGIGDKAISNIIERANEKNTCLYDCLETPKEIEFKNIIETIKKEKDSLSLTELVDFILVKSGIKKELESEGSMESEIRIENLEEFKSITKEFEEKNGIISLDEFLEQIALVADTSEYQNRNDVVTFMTIHSAKGLEFSYVFLVGMEEGIFPHANSSMSNDDLEEERRLCYVAVTRAKTKLWLLCTKKRMIFGQESFSSPSRFIDEIGKEKLEFQEPTIFETPKAKPTIDNNAEYNIGDKVMHNTFGKGIVVGIDSSILTIAFPNPHGIKKLMKGHSSILKI